MYCDDILETIDNELLERIDNELKSRNSTHLLSGSLSEIAVTRLKVLQRTTLSIVSKISLSMVFKSSNGVGDIWKDNGCFCLLQKQIRIISDISQHFVALNCFKSILETNGIFNYLCNEMIFAFLTEPSMFHIQSWYFFWNMKHRWLCQNHKIETIDNELLETIDNELLETIDNEL